MMSGQESKQEEKKIEVGLIILGNSGVGKSFLANTILGENDRFKHDMDCEAVTLSTEYASREVSDFNFAIYNIPGLIENDQKRIDKNKEEIEKAFKAHPFSIICYVFGNQGGRIRNEDVVAFKAIDAAYKLARKSLVFVVNNLDPRRPELYEGRTIVRLSKLLEIDEDQIKVTFVDSMDVTEAANSPAKLRVRASLLSLLMRARAATHKREQEIKLEKDQIVDLQAAEEAKQKEFDDLVKKNNEAIAKLTADAQAANKKYEQETNALREQLAKQPQVIKETIHHHHHKSGGCNIISDLLKVITTGVEIYAKAQGGKP